MKRTMLAGISSAAITRRGGMAVPLSTSVNSSWRCLPRPPGEVPSADVVYMVGAADDRSMRLIWEE